MSSPHELVNPESLPEPSGYSHAVSAASGRTVHVAGQIGCDAEGRVVGPDLVEQFEAAAANLVRALEAAGARPEHLVSLLIYTTDVAAYRESSREIGAAYRRRLGRHFPAMALFEVGSLFDPAAAVELVATAIVPDGERR